MNLPLPFFRICSFCAAYLCLFAAGAWAQSGTVTLVVGEARVTDAEGVWQIIQVGNVLQQGSKIQTSERGRCVVLTTSGSAIRIASNSLVQLDEMKDSTASGDALVTVQLKEGAVGALIDRSKQGEIDFKIETPYGVAIAHGTFYSVVLKGGKMFTKVHHGKVGVTAKAN